MLGRLRSAVSWCNTRKGKQDNVQTPSFATAKGNALGKTPDWTGVYPAATTQFVADYAIDLSATQGVLDALIRDGVHGPIVMGTVGENNSLLGDEKRQELAAAVEVVVGCVPVIVGVSEMTTPAAAAFARDAETIGA